MLAVPEVVHSGTWGCTVDIKVHTLSIYQHAVTQWKLNFFKHLKTLQLKKCFEVFFVCLNHKKDLFIYTRERDFKIVLQPAFRGRSACLCGFNFCVPDLYLSYNALNDTECRNSKFWWKKCSRIFTINHEGFHFRFSILLRMFKIWSDSVKVWLQGSLSEIYQCS